MRPAKAVKKFNGIQMYQSAALTAMDYALDSLNCITSPAGFLEKMRVPIPVSISYTQKANANLYDYQRADGLRQLIATLGTQIYKFEGDYLTPTLLDDNPLNQAEWSFSESNNLLFMANGNRMLKWTGTALQQWGIPQPAAPPVLAASFSFTGAGPTLTRTGGNLVTATFPGGVAFHSLQGAQDPAAAHIGDVIVVTGTPGGAWDGTFTLLSVGASFTWTQVGANTAVSAPNMIMNFQNGLGYVVGSVTLVRSNGIVTAHLSGGITSSWMAGGTVIVAGYGDASFNGTFQVISSDQLAGNMSWAQSGLGDASSTGGTLTPGLSNTNGISWRYAYGNSITGHVGQASDPVTATSVSLSTQYRIYTVNAVAPDESAYPSAQIDTIYWFRTFTGGGDYFLLTTTPISQLWVQDTTADLALDNTKRATLINGLPPVGNKLAKWQGRVFVSGIVGAPQDIAYSGYEYILANLGRPEESFPPFNRLRLSVGADDVRAMGAIQQGLVAWSHSNEMFMLKGTVEDIVVTAPANFSAYLDQLPWNQGANSHDAVQATPHGIAWFASDNTVQLWNGSFYGDFVAPKQLSEGIFPLLQRVTEAQKQFSKSAWLNYLEREWYVLLLPIDGSVMNNRVVFFDLTEGDSNAGVFVSDITADAITVKEDSRGGRHLLIIYNGAIYEVAFASTAQNGILAKKGLTLITGLTINTLVGPSNPIPNGNYYMRLVKVAYQGGETDMSDEFGPLQNGGTRTVQFSNLPPTQDAMRWRVYFGLQPGQLTQYVDWDPAVVATNGGVVYCSGTPQTFSAPPLRRMPAYWRGGWFGNDTPDTVKMFRDGHLVTSQSGFRLSCDLVDDESYTFDKPLHMDLPLNFGSRYSVNWKARRMSPTIQFPDADFPATVIELSASFNPGGQR